MRSSLSLEGIRLLVVDDEPDARELLAVLLSRAGADVETAESVAEALATLTRYHPHIVVSDIGMPDEDGYSFIRLLRASEAWATLPAIALTAFTRTEDRDRAHAAGFDLHMAKPVDPSHLIAAIAKLAGGAAS
jgi:CheY-like chemotaxis protein